MRKLLTYSFGAIALYLIVANSTGSGRVLSAGGASGTSLIKAFQGR